MRRTIAALVLAAAPTTACDRGCASPSTSTRGAAPEAGVAAGFPRLDYAELNRNVVPTEVSLSGDFGAIDVAAVSGDAIFTILAPATAVTFDGSPASPDHAGNAGDVVASRSLLLDAPADVGEARAPDASRPVLARDVEVVVAGDDAGRAAARGRVHVDFSAFAPKGLRLLLAPLAEGRPAFAAAAAPVRGSLLYVSPLREGVVHVGASSRVGEVELVAHGTLGEPSPAGTCDVGGRDPGVVRRVSRVDHDLAVVVRRARDASTVASKTFGAAGAPCSGTDRGPADPDPHVDVFPDERAAIAWLVDVASRAR